MNNIKVYTILTQLDKFEQNRLRKFLHSPYFNRNDNIIQVYEIFIEDINHPKKKELRKEEIWAKINPHQALNDVTLRKYFSDLLKLVERYFALEKYQEDPMNEYNHLLEAIQIRKIDKIYKSNKKAALKTLEKHPLRSSDYFLQNYLFEKNIFVSKENNYDKNVKSNVEKTSRLLDTFYVCEKLRYYSYILSTQFINTFEYHLDFIEEVIQFVEKSDLKNVPAVKIYYQNFLSLQEPEELSHFFELKSLLEEHSLKFPRDEAYNLYTSTLNYCIRKINAGQQEFLQEYFDINVDLLNKGIIYIDNYLDPSHFNNLVVSALRLQKYQWTEEFIEKFQHKVREELRQNLVTFNMARLRTYQKRHEDVIELLREVEYENFRYTLVSKTMLLATYYETNEIEPLISLLESFRTYLHRHKEIANNRRKSYLNFLKFTKKLTNLIPGDEEAILKMENEMANIQSLVNRDWLLEKLSELKK